MDLKDDPKLEVTAIAGPNKLAYQEINTITFNLSSDKPILVIRSNGTVEWFGDPSEVAKRFWKVIEECCPWPKPITVEQHDLAELAAIPVSYETPTDHYREMARRFAEDRDRLKHENRTLVARIKELECTTTNDTTTP